MEPGGEVIGAVGQWIAAVLQTLGLYTQGEIIANAYVFMNSFGALLYTVAILGGIISFALFGNYRNGLYLFIGPTLFWWVYGTTVPASHTNLCVGHRCETKIEGGNKMQAFIENFSKDLVDGDPPQVSWFFVQWDLLVSSVVQSVVEVLTDTENKEDIIQATRKRMLPELIMARSVEMPFAKLLSAGFMGHCANVNHLNQQKTAIEKHKKYIEDILAAVDPSAQPRVAGAQREVYEAQLEKLNIDLANINTKITEAGTGLSNPQIDLGEETREYLVALDSSFDPVPELVSCEQVWDYVRVACYKSAEAQKILTAEQIADPNIPWEEALEDVEERFGGPTEATQIIAAYILKNSLQQTSHQAMTSQLGEHQPWEQDKFTGVFHNVANHEALGQSMVITHFSGSIPYVQGILLYLLTVAFPFFAVFLILPGRYTSFFIWMSLWVWVKSWDIGFAFVRIVDDILWTYSHKSLQEQSLTEIDWGNPTSIIKLTNEYDPFAGLNTQYTIIAILTLAVPAFTAHLCLGATNLFEAFKQGMTGTSQDFGRRRAKASKALEYEYVQQEAARRVGEEANSAGDKAGMEGGKDAMGSDYHNGSGAKLSRYMDAEKRRAHFGAHFHNRGKNGVGALRGYGAALSGRTATFSINAASGLADAALNSTNEKYTGQDMMGAHTGWAGTDDRAFNDNMSAGGIGSVAGSTRTSSAASNMDD